MASDRRAMEDTDEADSCSSLVSIPNLQEPSTRSFLRRFVDKRRGAMDSEAHAEEDALLVQKGRCLEFPGLISGWPEGRGCGGKDGCSPAGEGKEGGGVVVLEHYPRLTVQGSLMPLKDNSVVFRLVCMERQSRCYQDFSYAAYLRSTRIGKWRTWRRRLMERRRGK